MTAVASSAIGQTRAGNDTSPPYRNPALPVEQRVEDLLSRMTLEEKVGQMNMLVFHLGVLDRDLPGMRDGCIEFVEGRHEKNPGKPAGGFFSLPGLVLKTDPARLLEVNNALQKAAMEKTRLGIPVMQIEEGTHGVMARGCTIFPEGLGIGASWNMDLVNRIYSATAKEGRALGIHVLCTLVVEPVRDPRMGRNEQGYSEDPYFCSVMARTMVKAVQGVDIAAGDKAIAALCHFPGQSEPLGGLERGAMDISERKLREVFLPPWTAGIKEAGALAVMATYPAVDGIPVHDSKPLLTGILRDELGFKGIVLEEGIGFRTLVYEGITPSLEEAGRMAIEAGVDVGITYRFAPYMDSLAASVQAGDVAIDLVDRSVRRILTLKFMLGLFKNPYVDPARAGRIVRSREHQQLALEAAREGIVLLKNEGDLLPLNKDISSIAVIGPNADAADDQLGDYFAKPVLQDVVSVVDGIKAKVPSTTKVSYVKGCNIMGTELNELAAATEAARDADVAVVVVGEGVDTNGEGKDVASLDLTGLQEDLIRAVHATGTPTIVVLINGRPLSTRWTAEHVPAIVEAWMCGEQGGAAVSDVLFGDTNPSGKLPITIPRHSGQLPAYYNYRPSKAFVVDNPEKGYVDMSATPLYPFGHGLSYTTFEYSNLKIRPEAPGTADTVHISVDIENTGSREGSEVVQFYVDDVYSSVTTPVKELRGFEKVALAPGEKRSVSFVLTPDQLSLLDKALKRVVEPGTFDVMIGASSQDIRVKGSFDVVGGAQ